MRRIMTVTVLLLVSCAAFAQEKPTSLYVFVANPSYTHGGISGDRWDGAFGLALQRMFTPRLSGEIAVSRQSDFKSDGIVREKLLTTYSTPVDLTASYHFFTHGAWKPYAGVGVRYLDSHAFGDVTAGVVWQFHRSLGLRFDAKVLVGNDVRFDHDQINAGVGLTWRF